MKRGRRSRCAAMLVAQWAGILLLAMGSGLGLEKLNAAPSQSNRFTDWCREQDQFSIAQQRTIMAMLQVAATTDCRQAEQVLETQLSLDLINQELTDITPLVTLPQLKHLNLAFNQIQDIRPLAKLTNLEYVVLEQNQVREVSKLASLKHLRLLNLLTNPINPKVCPVKPATVCLFSDAGQEIYTRAEQQSQRGNLQTALSLFQQALAIYQQDSDLQRQGDCLHQLGTLYLQLGQYPQALTYYQRALTLQREIEDQEGIGISLTSLASAYERLGQYDKAGRVLEDAIATLQTQNPLRFDGGLYEHPKEEGLLHHRLARIQIQQGRSPQALASLEQAWRLFQYLPPSYPGKAGGERLILDARGVAYFRQGKLSNAIEALTTALSLARTHDDQVGIGATLNHLGEVYLDQEQMQRALQTFEQALEIQRRTADQPGMGLTLHNMGQALLQAQQYPKAAANLLEAIEIWESLRPGLSDEHQVALFETQAATYQHLQSALIAQGQDIAALEVSERSRARAFIELLASRFEAQTTHPRPPKAPLTVQELRDIARAQDSTLVEYSLLEDQLLIWVIAPSGAIQLRTVDLTDQSLPDLIEATQEAIGIKDRGGIAIVATNLSTDKTGTPPLRQLHQLLIEPIADLLPTDPEQHVVIIPHRELFLVPFPALQSDEGPLILKHTLVSSPSIQLLAFTREQRKAPSGPGESLVVGNPQMPSIQVGSRRQPLTPLPGAEQEAVAIATLLNTQALIGPAATETAVVQQMTTASTIHLATHGLLDELSLDTPGAIALTPSSASMAPSSPSAPLSSTDGFLTTAEIINLRLQANLVVLSACNTGIGTITGDGVVGLARAFMAAGTPSIVVSLWSVPDAPTAALMTEFYRQKSTLNKAQALRQAMLITRQQHPNPKDWAAFMLMGEAQ
ncbi:Internalin-A [Acaryochloris thomasi RCC1774]|uniref:Internalin-A n=1 Tax=Acaryochloris thomasi RCC1774 TaxID=1764569 RepID=A0A2W1JMB7_9CYAN|nr:CHAT domain-containing protein [Acaryochloris thomasi]PZD74458.1 Internalin-A [Acaryochloris thomasi RCC1774]